ncbi:MAG: hypothetical protein KJO41_07340 [Bacteroidia bacterium]|nr:hypothetical protein [Bacteroidia bacterium]NND24701.1 hypothetical protein [Flavobacteriaceae bacterium]MBT8278799.1 hypothetical protein [Bacteroidia bacterium]NNK59043.1 hypothetical protein [Flavobacteriaceae bacterium]NNL33765.1 hypothetical protein [Flavobacteriaceae bacterium]
MKNIITISILLFLSFLTCNGQNIDSKIDQNFKLLMPNDSDFSIDLLNHQVTTFRSAIEFWFEEEPELDYQNIDFMEFFGLDLRFWYTKGSFDFLLSLENIFKLNWASIEIEPIQEFLSQTHDYITFSHVTDGQISLGIVYNF